MATHPLEVPEILTRIGQYLPLWVERDEDDLGDKVIAFDHQTLLSCMQVSKLWHQTLLPILWHSYDGLKMNALPQEMMEPAISLATQKELIHSNPRLRYLEWHGPERTTALEMEDFVGLKCLQELRLFHWDGGDRRLARVLRAVSGTIKTFEVSRIQGVLPGDLSGALHRLLDPILHPEVQEEEYIVRINKNKNSSNSNKGNGINNSNRNSVSNDSAAMMTDPNLFAPSQTDALVIRDQTVEEGLVLPYMEKIKVIFDRNPDYVELAQCCPNLKRLTVAGLGHGDTYRLSRCLRDHCQKLKVLVLKDVLLPQEEAIELLRSCLSAGGLTKIHLDVVGFQQDCISAILLHSSTLEQLTIASTEEDAVDLEGVLRIMVECTKLKTLRFMLDTAAPDTDVLEAWRAEEWACTGLERLGLEFNYCEFGDEDDEEGDSEDDDEGYDIDEEASRDEDEDKNTVEQHTEREEEKIRQGTIGHTEKEEGCAAGGRTMTISSEIPYMGWYRHPQESHDFGSSGRRKRDETDKPALRMLFEMVQGLSQLHTLVWKDIEYSRSRTPRRCRHIK
ncbi:hypothetical protein BGZ97_006014 [Linnemannia gamsii]|uniref:F-box domain-containing protein n=1 Tax=Linnemannia gamsii TaxID=64522 RepID=A0A9P6QRD9_9FUNG|nr:hypothetical protein BGZ97_006014 [Linnemannia gamsii]